MFLRLFSLPLVLMLSLACVSEEGETVKSAVYRSPCPSGYSLVSQSYELATPSFCLSQDLMALDAHSRLTVRKNGLYALTVTKDEAESLCQSLGVGYDLVSMSEYQAAAREIESNDVNWSQGRIGWGSLGEDKEEVKLISGDSLDGAGVNYRNGLVDAYNSWTKEYFNSFFTSGYNFDVKAGEFYLTNFPLIYANAPYDDVGKWFAPKGDYSTLDAISTGLAGLGFLHLNSGAGYISRGAFTLGPFEARFRSISSSYSAVGFHCVYHFSN